MNLLVALLIFFSPSELHKFYVSLSDITYNEESHRLEVASKYFIDDLEKALELGPDEHIDMPMREELLPKMGNYLSDRLIVRLDNELASFDLIGYEVEDDVVWVYLESDVMPDFSEVEIQATQLSDVYPEQQNIVHFSKGGVLKSLFLRKEKPQDTLTY